MLVLMPAIACRAACHWGSIMQLDTDVAGAMWADEEVRLSMDVWTDLLADFIRDVIGQPVYVAGNSLGGFLSANLAAQQPAICRWGMILVPCPTGICICVQGTG